MLQTFPKFRVWLKNSSVTIKIILQNSKIHMKKVKKRCNIQKSMSGLLTAPKTNCFQKITSGWTPTIRSTRMRVCKNLKNPNIPGKTLYAQSKWEKNYIWEWIFLWEFSARFMKQQTIDSFQLNNSHDWFMCFLKCLMFNNWNKSRHSLGQLPSFIFSSSSFSFAYYQNKSNVWLHWVTLNSPAS